MIVLPSPFFTPGSLLSCLGVERSWSSVKKELMWCFDLSAMQADALLKRHYEKAK